MSFKIKYIASSQKHLGWMNVLQAYEVQSAICHLDDSRNQQWSGHLLSELLNCHISFDGKGCRFTLGNSSHWTQTWRELHQGTHSPWAHPCFRGIWAVSKGTWAWEQLDSSAPRAGTGRGFPPPTSLELLIPGSVLPSPPACTFVLETLPHPCSRSYQSCLVILISLNWLVLVPATCKPNTLTVKAEHSQICTARVR